MAHILATHVDNAPLASDRVEVGNVRAQRRCGVVPCEHYIGGRVGIDAGEQEAVLRVKGQLAKAHGAPQLQPREATPDNRTVRINVHNFAIMSCAEAEADRVLKVQIRHPKAFSGGLHDKGVAIGRGVECKPRVAPAQTHVALELVCAQPLVDLCESLDHKLQCDRDGRRIRHALLGI